MPFPSPPLPSIPAVLIETARALLAAAWLAAFFYVLDALI
jgi:hypothetical protein